MTIHCTIHKAIGWSKDERAGDWSTSHTINSPSSASVGNIILATQSPGSKGHCVHVEGMVAQLKVCV